MVDKPRFRCGEKLRLVRERKGITLRQVAERIHVSESLISQIERNRVSPSVDTLIALADTLDIDLEYLFEDFKKNKQVTYVKKDERFKHYVNGITYEQLSVIQDPMDEYTIEALLIELPAGCSTENRDYGHKGKELGIILTGKGYFKYGTQEFVLEKGDSISFSSDIPHTLKNVGEAVLQAIWICTPPKLFGKM